MKIDARVLLVTGKLCLLALWPVTAMAATITFGEKMAAIPLLAVLMTVVLSTLSGATALLHHLKQEYERAGEVQRLGLFITSKMLGSNTAGLLMFFAAETWNFSDTMTAAAIILAAFAGTWAIERAAVYFIDKYFPAKP